MLNYESSVNFFNKDISHKKLIILDSYTPPWVKHNLTKEEYLSQEEKKKQAKERQKIKEKELYKKQQEEVKKQEEQKNINLVKNNITDNVYENELVRVFLFYNLNQESLCSNIDSTLKCKKVLKKEKFNIYLSCHYLNEQIDKFNLNINDKTKEKITKFATEFEENLKRKLDLSKPLKATNFINCFWKKNYFFSFLNKLQKKLDEKTKEMLNNIIYKILQKKLNEKTDLKQDKKLDKYFYFAMNKIVTDIKNSLEQNSQQKVFDYFNQQIDNKNRSFFHFLIFLLNKDVKKRNKDLFNMQNLIYKQVLAYLESDFYKKSHDELPNLAINYIYLKFNKILSGGKNNLTRNATVKSFAITKNISS